MSYLFELQEELHKAAKDVFVGFSYYDFHRVE